MNLFCKSAVHQMEVAVQSISEMMDKLNEEDLDKRPTTSKRSIRELLTHIAVICEAGWRISTGSTEGELKTFYAEKPFEDLHTIKKALIDNFEVLKHNVENLTEEDLYAETTSYWGVTYTRYEWLLEMTVHLYHHRGQLHAMLVHSLNKDPEVSLFE